MIKPQKGPQEQFLASSADICIYGGAAGGGKTFGMLIDPLRHIDISPDGGAVYFRRTITQITNEGGLFDEAKELYFPFGVKDRSHPKHEIIFKNKKDPSKDGFKITFSHLQYEKDKYNYQGAQIPIIYFDELTHFTKTQFFYLVGRNRSTCGIKPYLRATCNPDKNSWVRDFLDWWIDDEGYADFSKSGKIRWLIRNEGKEYWYDSRELALKEFPEDEPLSVSFIPARLKDNEKLLLKDPGYKAKLKSLDKVERERLLGDEEKGGNWNVEPVAGSYFQKYYFEEVEAVPPLKKVVRAWDRAATEYKPGMSSDPDWTVGLKLGVDKNGIYYVLDIIRVRYSAHKVEQLIRNTAIQDGVECYVRCFQDPGGAGKNEAEMFVRMMAGFMVDVEKINVNKEIAAKAVSAQSEAGNVKIISSCQSKVDFYAELTSFPMGKHDDIVDAFSSAFNFLSLAPNPVYTKKMRETKIDSIIKRNRSNNHKDKW